MNTNLHTLGGISEDLTAPENKDACIQRKPTEPAALLAPFWCFLDT